MTDYRALIANCTVAGMEITGNEKSWVRDTINFEICGRVFTLKQNRQIVKGGFQKLQGEFCETSELIIKNVKEDELAELESDIRRLCWLLSFACLSNVVFYGYDYPANQNTGRRWAVSGKLGYFRPTIEIRDGEIVKSFIEQTFNKYKTLESSRKLNVVIHYMLLIENYKLPIEAKLALSFVLLENLKSSFAHSKNIPYIGNRFKKGENPNKKSLNYEFRELLEMMLKEVNMNKNLDQVIKVRNEIIHSGLTELPYDKAQKLYEDTHDLYREYLLRLLGYHGEYRIYSSVSNTAASI